MKEADEIYVLDTGSTDGSYKLLKKLGVHVKRKKFDPFRFDIARNMSLELVPKDTDLYVCTDIDERFEKGWRKLLEDNFKNGYTRIKYLYNWSFVNGKPATTFYLNKIHTKGYKWINPVHEVLQEVGIENKELLIENIILNHYQDTNKSRNSYLPLLELSVKENPNNDRNMHYLGREYMYYKMYDNAIETLHRHLNLESATWKDERCASMRFIARCYDSKHYIQEAIFWYNLAINEAPYLRESYVELAYMMFRLKKYNEVIMLLDKALEIKEKSKNYINEAFAWNECIYDLYARTAYFLNKKDIAIKFNNIAISINSFNENLKNNSLIYTN